MRTTFIYALKCPTTNAIRYVGKANNPKTRFPRHLRDARNGEVYHRAVWIRSLLAKNQKPLLEIIDEVADGFNEGLPLEAAYIQFFRDEGCDLTNATPGGEGGPSMSGARNPNFGKPMSAERKAQITATQSGENAPCWGRTGAKHPMFGKTGALHPMFGHQHTPDAIEKIKAKRAAQILTPERNAKISASMQGDKHHMFGKEHTEAAKEKIKAARSLQVFSEDVLEKRATAIRAAYAIKKVSGGLPKNCKISIGAF